MRVDLNGDIGESEEPDRTALDEGIMTFVSSVNVACGVHAGSPPLMRRLVRAAKTLGVEVGAHPGLRDPEGLGRREVTLAPEEVEALVTSQVRALAAIAAEEGVALAHVKPHGVLYNRAARDRALAAAIARAVAAVDRRLRLFGLAGSLLIEEARALGLHAVEEAFADRAYRADGSLVPRDRAGAVIVDEAAVVARVLRMVREGSVRSVEGTEVPLHADTICLHGDTPGAARLARLVREALESAGVRIAAVDRGREP